MIQDFSDLESKVSSLETGLNATEKWSKMRNKETTNKWEMITNHNKRFRKMIGIKVRLYSELKKKSRKMKK